MKRATAPYSQYCALLSALLLCSCAAFGQRSGPGDTLCFVPNMLTEVPPGMAELRVKSHLFATGPNTTAELRIQNASSMPIIAMQVTFEYYGESGERIGDVVGAVIAKQVPEPQAFEIGKRMTAGGATDIPNILQPGETASVGVLGTFTALSCPARAKLTSALLWFSDSTSLDWSAPGARLDPEPNELNLSKLPGCLLQHGVRSLYLTLELNREGRVASVEYAAASASPKVECDTSEISKWKFRPALQDGNPLASTIPILFRVHDASELPRDTWDHVSPGEVPHRLVVVDALPPARGKSAWRVFFGGEPPNNTQNWGK